MAGDPTITVRITGDTSGLGKATRDAEVDVQGFGSKVSGFAVGAGAAITTFAISAVPKLLGVGAELYNLGQSSAINLAKADTVFGDSSGTVKAWADSVNESLGLSDEKVIGLAASMGDLLVPLGLSREAAAGLSTETLDAAGALAAWSGGQYDASQVADIMTKAMLGERDGLKALGISINQAEVDERALAIARKDGRDEITAVDQALATQELMLEKSSDAQAAWANGTMDAVKQQNELSATVADAKEALGRGLLPIVQRVTAWIVSDMIPAVREIVDVFREKWPEIQAAVEPVLLWLQQTTADVIAVVQSFWDQFGERIMTYVEIVWSYVQETIGNALRAVQAIFDVVLGVLSGDWSRAWEGIRDLVGAIWDQITNLVRTATRALGLVLDAGWEVVKGIVRAGVDAVVGFVTGIPGRIAGTISSLWSGIGTGFDAAKEYVRLGVDAVVGFVTGIPGRIAGTVSSAFQAIPRAFKSAINGIIDAWNGLSFRIKGGPWDPLGSFGPEIPAVNFGFDTPNIPRLAAGGLVKRREGGILAVIGEGNYDEAVIPLDGRTQMGGTTNVYQSFPAGTSPSAVVKAQRDWIRRNGPIESAA
jgi:hypothetical protein